MTDIWVENQFAFSLQPTIWREFCNLPWRAGVSEKDELNFSISTEQLLRYVSLSSSHSAVIVAIVAMDASSDHSIGECGDSMSSANFPPGTSQAYRRRLQRLIMNQIVRWRSVRLVLIVERLRNNRSRPLANALSRERNNWLLRLMS